MSRIESGKISLSEEEFNLAELVDNLVTMIKPGIQMHQHHFEVHLNQIEHEDVCGDSLRIQQLVTNIMSNAIIGFTSLAATHIDEKECHLRQIKTKSDFIKLYE